MSVWRYTAIENQPPHAQRSGELLGSNAAEVRASLRRIGLQVVELRSPSRRTTVSHRQLDFGLKAFLLRHLRNRRRAVRAELYDSLATMLNAGLPLLETLQTLIDSRRRTSRATSGAMLVDIRERLRSGASLGQAMSEHHSWFEPTDVAIVEAGQHAGNLAQVLLAMAQRQERSNELSNKIVGAMAYPFLVSLVGFGVAVFLSVKTLPELVKILHDAKIQPPALTLKVMGIGQLFAYHWLTIVFVVVICGFLALLVRSIPARYLPVKIHQPLLRVRRPKVFRTLMVGGLTLRLAELLRSGVPMVEALRVIAPTVTNSHLRELLVYAAIAVERGDDLAHAFSDEHWFNAEFRRLLDVGQTTGELDVMLQRIGERYQRQSQRLIGQLTALLEPIVILALAALVGLVVMAAILPLIRLQEILK